MSDPSKISPQQLRFSLPWKGKAPKCQGCPYLSPVGNGKDTWQCAALRDFAGVVSERALCLAHQRPIPGQTVHWEGSEVLHEDTDSPAILDDYTGDEFCPRCGQLLVKDGCWVCECGYRECS